MYYIRLVERLEAILGNIKQTNDVGELLAIAKAVFGEDDPDVEKLQKQWNYVKRSRLTQTDEYGVIKPRPPPKGAQL